MHVVQTSMVMDIFMDHFYEETAQVSQSALNWELIHRAETIIMHDRTQ